MFCPQCNSQIPDGLPACPVCGMPTGMMPDASMAGQMPFAADMSAMAADPMAAMPAMADPMGAMPAMSDPMSAMPAEMPSENYSTDFYSQPAQSFAPVPAADQTANIQTANLPVFPASQQYGAMASATPAVRIIQTVSDETERPVTFWQSVGFFILILVPLVGFIATIIFACSRGINRNIRNLSRAYLMLCLIPLLIVLIFLLASIMLTGDAFSCVSQFTQ